MFYVSIIVAHPLSYFHKWRNELITSFSKGSNQMLYKLLLYMKQIFRAKDIFHRLIALKFDIYYS